ncbi:MAG TPA: hypothetical protein VFT12_13235 [Thermoanaerobaculia bacterium]|nr:hypothetical protein [Thermoanaerobaculia bacterium]
MEQHIRIVAVLYIVLGVLGLLAAVAVLVLGAGAGLMSGDPDAAIVGGTCATIVAVVIAVLSLPNVIAGIGLKNRREWARILTIILSVLNLFNVPVGTAIGVYALWALLNDQSRAYFVR